MKYWLKIRSSENCILQACYSHMLKENDVWLMNVKAELFRIGLGYIWEDPHIYSTSFELIKSRIFDIFKQECSEKIAATTKCYFLYRHIPNTFSLQFYLQKSNKCRISERNYKN